MKKKKGNGVGGGEVPKQKERHIVSRSQEEDDILREQIRVHGTENWAIIASNFRDKTTRQCRRRWFTYLNSDFKKGGWSPEEDMLLCEAQKIFGNRWTEIAKVVSGRTDNAVKNRFTTLCKKRAKHEALANENNSSYINLNNKRVVFPNGLDASVVPLKKTRTSFSNATEKQEETLPECGVTDHLLRPPFAVLPQNVDNHKDEATFLKKDDPKVVALMQQAELLSSLAVKVNNEKTDQSLDSAWMALQDFLKQNKESEVVTLTDPDVDFQIDKFKEMVADLRSSTNEDSRSAWREPDMYESSPASSEFSTGSTLMSNVQDNKTGDCQTDLQSPDESRMCHIVTINEVNILASDDAKENNEAEFGSPLHVTPLFRALAATIPSPQFSESEKHFLMKTLGMESTSSASCVTNPPCKRSLLHCL